LFNGCPQPLADKRSLASLQGPSDSPRKLGRKTAEDSRLTMEDSRFTMDH
jgi:hypothetical protein